MSKLKATPAFRSTFRSIAQFQIKKHALDAFLLVIMFFTGNTLFAQQIIQMDSLIVSSTPGYASLISNSSISAYLQTNGFVLSQTAHEVLLDDNKKFWVIDMNKPGSQDNFSLVTFYANSQIKHLLLSNSEIDQQGDVSITLIDLQNLNTILSNTLNTGGGSSQDTQTCRERSATYGDCFVCAWNDLHSIPAGIITCSLLPAICIAAGAIHCAPLIWGD